MEIRSVPIFLFITLYRMSQYWWYNRWLGDDSTWKNDRARINILYIVSSHDSVIDFYKIKLKELSKSSFRTLKELNIFLQYTLAYMFLIAMILNLDNENLENGAARSNETNRAHSMSRLGKLNLMDVQTDKRGYFYLVFRKSMIASCTFNVTIRFR